MDHHFGHRLAYFLAAGSPKLAKALARAFLNSRKASPKASREYEDAKEELRQVEEDLKDHD